MVINGALRRYAITAKSLIHYKLTVMSISYSELSILFSLISYVFELY